MPSRRQPELMTTDEVAEYLGYTTRNARTIARRQLLRWGIEPVARQPKADGQNLYPADAVRKRLEARTGQGRRTDLEPPNAKE